MPAPPDEIWNDIRDDLRRVTPEFKYHIWIEPLDLAAIRGNALYVRAPEHIRTSVSERYLPLLRQAAVARFDPRAGVEIVGQAGPRDRPPGHSGEQPRRSPPDPAEPEVTCDQFVIARATTSLTRRPWPWPRHSPGLQPLSCTSARPGRTHLLPAGNTWGFGRGTCALRNRREFTTELVDAVERPTGDSGRFRERTSLIDDVQFLAGRTKTREEFFHTFNALLDSGRQLVITSDRPPDELPDLEARLAERFRSGLVVELEHPPADARRAILAKRAHIDGVLVSDEVLDEIAGRVTSSVRALEGALIRVVAYAS